VGDLEAEKVGESKEVEESQPTPIKPQQEEKPSQESQAQPLLPSSDETVITAVKGILDALAEQTSERPKESETLPKSESEKVQPPEEELDKKGKESLEKPEEKSKPTPSKPSELRSQKSVEKEVKFKLPEDHRHSEDEEEVEEEEVVRPPTPPRTLSKKSKHSAAAAIAAAKAQGGGGHKGHNESVSVVGFEETAELQSGGKWGDRTPTPTFRMATPPVPHHPPTPPADIPSIFLDGPLPTPGQQFMVSDSQVEMEGGGDDLDEDDPAPIILSGKVTLSVISGLGGTDDLTEASSISSYDDRGHARGASSKKDGLAIKAEKGLSSSKKSPVSSPDMDEYEVIKSAEADVDGQKPQEDTAGDISEIDGLGKHEDLPHDLRKDEE
jgi:hypothetical protein